MILRETQGRKRLEKEVNEQRGLIDALTAETMTLREEVTALQVRESIFQIHHSVCDGSVGCLMCEHTDLELLDRANKCCLFFSVSSLGQVATADSPDGAEVGHSGDGDGRTWTNGHTR